jgi:hypothetical protein
MMRRVAQMRAEKMIGMLFGMRKIISSVVAGLLCFGASISVPASAQADDLKAMLNKAGQEKTGVDLTAGRTYVVPETLNVPEGVRYIRGHGAHLDVRTQGTSSTLASAFELQSKNSGIELSDFTLNMKASSFSSGISGDHISNVTVRNVTMNDVNFRGVSILADHGDVSNVTVDRSTITMANENDGVVPIFVSTNRVKDDYTGKGAEVWERYVATGKTADPMFKNTDIKITDNTIDGGYYGIEFSGVTSSHITGNTIRNNTRNISMQDRSSNNTVENNQLRDSISSSVHIAYGSEHNDVKGNNIVTRRAYGQGILQAYQGSKNNTFSGNSVTTRDKHPSWLLYVGPDSGGTTFTGNTVDGTANRAFVGVESVWDGDSSLSHLNDAKDNPHSYMVQGESKKPSGETVRYAGGNGPLENITITGNTFTPRNKTLPVVYVGAEVSKAQNGRQEVRGDIKGVNVSGNTVKGVKGNDYSELLVTHEGSLDKLGPATISFTDKSVVAQ